MPPQLDNKSYYNEFSSWYERKRAFGYHAMLDSLTLQLCTPHCTDKDVLEAGCGTGLILKEIAAVAKRAVGMDISSGMLSTARKRGLNVCQADITHLPFQDSSFDVVLCFKVLAHIHSIKSAIHELARITRPGGTLLIDFYNPLSWRWLFKSLMPGKISQNTRESAVYTRWDFPWNIPAYLPPSLSLEKIYGLRTITPAAAIFNLPFMNSVLFQLERWALDSPLRYLGGFLIVELHKSNGI